MALRRRRLEVKELLRDHQTRYRSDLDSQFVMYHVHLHDLLIVNTTESCMCEAPREDQTDINKFNLT